MRRNPIMCFADILKVLKADENVMKGSRMEKGNAVTFGMSAGRIKLIAAIAMFIDHFAASVLIRLIRLTDHPFRAWLEANTADYQTVLDGLEIVYQILRDIGRLSFPIYCFFIVEGFFNTKNRTKYALRLFVLALISEAPFDLALFGKISDFKHQNVYFTLLIGLGAIWGINALRKKAESFKIKEIILLLEVGIVYVSTVFAFFLKTDYSILGVLCIIIMYQIKVPREDFLSERLLMLLAGMAVWWQFKTPASFMLSLVISILAIIVLGIYLLRCTPSYMLMAFGGIFCLCVTGVSEIPAITALILMFWYNGKKGINPKWFFYFFYPVHLAVFALVCVLFWLVKL